MSCGFFPALDKAGWREAPGWFEAVIPQLKSDSYRCHIALLHRLWNFPSLDQEVWRNAPGWFEAAIPQIK